MDLTIKRKLLLLPIDNSIELNLEGNLKLSIQAKDMAAMNIVSQLSEIMELQLCRENADTRLILRSSTNEKGLTFKYANNNSVICTINPFDNPEMSIVNIIWLSLLIAKAAHVNGGILLHGALAEYKDSGVIMAGPGGIGKTTASSKLCPPWKSLSDDCTLVTYTKNGEYRAHPWPTWSRFMFGGKGGSWNVEYSVKLQAIFFLSRLPSKEPVAISSAEAVAMLVQSSQQAWGYMLTIMEKEEIMKIRVQMFNNICRLIKNIPCYILSLDGNFQEKMTSFFEPRLND